MKNLSILFIITFSLLSFAVSAQKFTSVEELDTIEAKDLTFTQIQMENDDDYSSFAILDSAVVGYKYFFVGENHQFRYSNSKMELKFLKYLYHKVGVRTLVLEFGYARGYLINKYINNIADSNYYQLLSDYSYQEYADLYKNIRDFNLSLPDSARITVLGIDVERFEDLPAKLMSMLIPEQNEYHDSISLSIESLIGLAYSLDKDHKEQKIKLRKDNEDNTSNRFFLTDEFNTMATLDPIIENFERHEVEYKKLLGDKFEIFKIVINEVKDMVTYRGYYNQTQQYVYREQYMFKKLKQYIELNPDAKIFGQFGRCHVSTLIQDEACDWFKYYSIASRLEKYSKCKGKVFSIGVFYPQDENFSEYYSEFYNLQGAVKAAIEDSISIIATNGDTNSFDQFAKFYNFIMVNNASLEVESEYFTEEDNPYAPFSTNKEKSYFSLVYQIVNRSFDFNTLNKFMNNQQFGNFNSNIISHRFGYSTLASNRVTSGLMMEFIKFNTISSNKDTLRAEMSGFNIESSNGFDLIKSKYVTLKPNFGIGYSNLSLKIYQEDSKINKDSSFFGDYQVIRYQNPCFYLNPSLELIFNFKYIGLGGVVGYNYDVSNKLWISDFNGKTKTGPKTSLSNLYYGINLSFIFDF